MELFVGGLAVDELEVDDRVERSERVKGMASETKSSGS